MSCFISGNFRDYRYYTRKNADKHSLKTIDGKIVGCGKCVGFCSYREHSGFLTKEQREKHNCINKKCDYYITKSLKEKAKTKEERFLEEDIKRAISKITNSCEGFKITSVKETDWYTVVVKYITISHEYDVMKLEKEIGENFGCNVVFEKLKYDYEVCVRLLLS